MRTVKILFASLIISLTGMTQAIAADYIIDTIGAHASIDFRFKHLNISWLTGEFKEFDGKFSYDEANPESASIEVTINTASIDSNHAERDKHMRGDKYLNVEKYPTATFSSTRVVDHGNGKTTVYGNLNLHGVTQEIAIDANFVGAGNDPWGGYRIGFEGKVTLDTSKFGFKLPPTNEVEMSLFIEGIRK